MIDPDMGYEWMDPETVGESILDKQGKLTDAEYALRRQQAFDVADAVNASINDKKLQKKLDEADWVYDPVGASRDARTHSRPKNAPPHWVRCDFVRDGVRCVKGEGHEKGYGEHAKHEGPKT